MLTSRKVKKPTEFCPTNRNHTVFCPPLQVKLANKIITSNERVNNQQFFNKIPIFFNRLH